MDEYVILIRFGILEVNQKVKGHRATSDLWHVYYKDDWHTVTSEDVEKIN